jgi:hypothetical protein
LTPTRRATRARRHARTSGSIEATAAARGAAAAARAADLLFGSRGSNFGSRGSNFELDSVLANVCDGSMTPHLDRRMLAADVARALGVTTSRVNALVEEGVLPVAEVVGGSGVRIFDPADVAGLAGERASRAAERIARVK